MIVLLAVVAGVILAALLLRRTRWRVPMVAVLVLAILIATATAAFAPKRYHHKGGHTTVSQPKPPIRGGG